jgi:NAD(P)-dependent dehydrogenase (short-subunit alcohol dehydrogenase family)
MTEIKGKTAVVTGSGSGIGRGIAKALAKEGAKVVVADIIKENADKVVTDIKAAGGNAIAVVCDVCEYANVQKLKEEANKAFGTVGIVVANAGATSFEALTDMPIKDVEWILQVNLLGVTYCMHTFIPDMIAARDGHVAATASMAGMLPGWLPYHAPYSAAKMGIMGMMLNLRLELEDYNVGTSVYCPGGVQSGMNQNNAKYRPARFGGPRTEPVKIPGKTFVGKKMSFYTPDHVALMVVDAIRHNRPIVVDHADQRQDFMDNYVKPVLEAFDTVAAFEKANPTTTSSSPIEGAA